MLEIENLHFRYSRRGPPVLNGVNLTLRDGDVTKTAKYSITVQEHTGHPETGKRKYSL